jgi:Mrp family chromosome partitioning ATPase
MRQGSTAPSVRECSRRARFTSRPASSAIRSSLAPYRAFADACAPGGGKTTIARNLAAAAAKMGSRVLLLEADLRRTTVAQQLGIPAGKGLSDVLIGAVSLAETTRTLDLDFALRAMGQGRTLSTCSWLGRRCRPIPRS